MYLKRTQVRVRVTDYRLITITFMNAFYFNQRLSARILAAVALFSLVASLVPMQAFAVNVEKPINCGKDEHLEGDVCVADLNPNVTICHANKGENLYTSPTVDAKSIVNLPNGHKDHDKGGLDDKGDIIPSFTYNFGVGLLTYPGKNLTTNYTGGLTGQQILDNGCVVPEDQCLNIDNIQITVPRGLVKDQAGNCVTPSANLTISKVIYGIQNVLASAFSFVLNDSDPEAFGTNPVSKTLEVGTGYDVVEFGEDGGLLNGYSVEYSDECSGELGENGADCVVTNTWIPTCSDGMKNGTETGIDTGGNCPVDPNPNCTDPSAYNNNQTLPCVYDVCPLDIGLQTTLGQCTPAPDPVCENPNAQNYGEKAACIVYESVCTIPTNLLSNGSFEDPTINQSWDRSLVTGWNVTKVSDGSASPLGEIWRGLVTPSHLLQNLELDGDYPTKITQATTTIPGATYELRFDFSARSGYGVADNNIVSAAGGLPLTSVATTNTNWVTYGGTFTATTTTTNISFADVSVNENNSYGTLLDNAVLCLVRVPVVDFCPNILDNQTADEGYAKDVNGQCYTPINACSLTVVSDETNTYNDSAAIAIAPNGAWASIAGAQWIWGVPSNTSITPFVDEVQTFKKTFVWSGTPSTATLKISSDNGYSVKLNDTVVGADADEFNYQSVDTIIDITDNIISGVNTLEISVTNKGNASASLASNPGGLLYDLTITNTTGDCAPGGGGGNDDVLSCSITASENSIRRGRDVTINWSSVDAAYVTIPNLGDELGTSGSQLVENLGEDTTYTMTVFGDVIGNTDTREQATCSVTVDTRSGGGGGGGNRVDRTPDGDVLGASDDKKPTGEVLGAQTDAIPTGAPNTGKGGSSTEVFGQFLATPRRRNHA